MEGKTFHRRELKPPGVALSSNEGRALFKEAISDGNSNDIYFQLAEVMNTQAHPAYCGVTSLAVVLNALLIDPKRTWKGVWRWWSEEMLDCCTPLEKVQMQGITLAKLNCLAQCQGAKSRLVYGTECSLGEFREVVMNSCASVDADTNMVIASYSRPALNQSGSGHFSPIGAYHREKDMVLILDTARFKLPPHWVPLPELHKAMEHLDKETGKPRGFLVISSSEELDKRCKCHDEGTCEEGEKEETDNAADAEQVKKEMQKCAKFVGSLVEAAL